METKNDATDAIPRSTSRLKAPLTNLSLKLQTVSTLQINKVPTAIVYCEGNFGKVDGKTANGLIRHSQACRIVSVIDSSHNRQDSGQILDDVINNIPIFGNLKAAVVHERKVPDTFIDGMAPSTGKFSSQDRIVILDAIA